MGASFMSWKQLTTTDSLITLHHFPFSRGNAEKCVGTDLALQMQWLEGRQKKNGDKRLNDLKEQIKNSLATNAHEDFHESVGTYT